MMEPNTTAAQPFVPLLCKFMVVVATCQNTTTSAAGAGLLVDGP